MNPCRPRITEHIGEQEALAWLVAPESGSTHVVNRVGRQASSIRPGGVSELAEFAWAALVPAVIPLVTEIVKAFTGPQQRPAPQTTPTPTPSLSPTPTPTPTPAPSAIPPQLIQQLTQLVPLLTQLLTRQSQRSGPAREAASKSNEAQETGDYVSDEVFRTSKKVLESEDHGIEGPIPDQSPVKESEIFIEQVPVPEYPQASRFAPAAPSNYRRWTSSSPRVIRRIVIHITDGGANINGTISWFQNPAARVSAHYIVGRDGEVVQMVHHNDVAWHAHTANADSIGIEHVANTRGLLPTPAQYCSSAALVRWLCERYGIPMDRAHIQGHSEADPQTTHTGCPNAVWDWNYFMGMVTSASCFPPPVPEGVPEQIKEAPETINEASGESAFEWLSQAQASREEAAEWLADSLEGQGISFDYNVPGTVPIIAQPSNNTCWATVATMMVSWRDRVTYTFQAVMDMAGPFYRTKFDNNQGLLGSEKPAFLDALGLRGETPMSYTVNGLRSLLERYGPLWATTDEQPGAGFSIHARIITGIFGDGTVDGTFLRINDPSGGRQYTETFRTFMRKFEEVVGAGPLRVQIVHF